MRALVVKIRIKPEYREQFLEQMWAAPLEVARCTTVYPSAGAWKKRAAP
jgi:hypothetical protein